MLKEAEAEAAMGNCFSDVSGGRSAVGGTAAFQANPSNAPNEAVDAFLKSRGYNGLYSQIEVFHLFFFLLNSKADVTSLSLSQLCTYYSYF